MNETDNVIEAIKRKSVLAKWGLALLGVVILAPVSFFLAYAVFGAALLGLALAFAGAVGLAVLAGVPWLVTKLANKRIEWVMAEARRSPIPTLWAGHLQDAEDLAAMGDAIVEYSTEINNAKEKARKLAGDLLPEDLRSFQADVAAMETDLALQEQDYREAQEMHAKQETEIKRASAIWDLNMAVANANAKNLNSRAQDTLAKIKKDTALDAVASSMNRSKAQLRQRIQQRSALHVSPSLGFEPSQVIDLVPQAIKVQR